MQSFCVAHAHINFGRPTFQLVEADVAVLSGPGFEVRWATSQEICCGLVPRSDLIVLYWPSSVESEWPLLEIDIIVRHATAAPPTGGSAEGSANGHAHRGMTFFINDPRFG